MSTTNAHTIHPKKRTPFVPFLLLLSAFLFSISTLDVKAQNLDVPYVPTPEPVVEKMLDLANVNNGDYVIDLGSGDGRIVIAAAKRGASGHGIDLDPDRVSEARDNAAKAGVSDRIMFMEENIFDTDFSNASVITMYLLPTVNTKLRPELLDKLEPGTRVVSHSFDMDEWKADKRVTVKDDDGSGSHDIYYWVIPAKVSGTWSWQVQNNNFTMSISQEFQEIDVSLADDAGNVYQIKSSDLHGDRLNIQAVNGTQRFIFNGRVEGDKIIGVQQYHNEEEKTFSNWTAQRR